MATVFALSNGDITMTFYKKGITIFVPSKYSLFQIAS